MAVTPDPARTLPLLRRAMSAAKHGNKASARETLRELLEIDPGNEAALLLAAETAATGKESEHFLSEALRMNPGCAQAMTSLALLRLSPTLAAEKAPDEPGAALGPVLWVCPLCDEGARTKDQIRCPNCGAILAIENLERLQANRGVDEHKLTAALERWKNRATLDPRFETNLNVARILLNLHQSGEALGYLRAACRANPVATGLKMLYDLLERRPVVLAADESPIVRRIISILVGRAGYLALSASDGLEALALLDVWSPHMMFVASEMNRMDGYEVCRAIRHNAHLAEVPLIILFEKDGFFVKVKGAMAGATDYLVKPVEETELMKLMMRYAPGAAAAHA
ncbi:MAG: response regulator [Bryobacteraceae bacterium]